MRTLHWIVCGWLVATGLAAADEPTSPPKPTLPPGTPAEQIKALIGQYETARDEFSRRFKAAKTDEEQQKLLPLLPDPLDYAVLLVQVAERHPNEPAAFDALLWAARYGRRTRSGDGPYEKAKATLARDYLPDPRIGSFCWALRHETFDSAAVGMLRDVLAKNPSRPVQAQAAFTLALLLQERADWAEFLTTRASPEQLAGYEKAYGTEAIAALKRGDAVAQRKEAEQLLERVLAGKDYAATTVERGTSKVTLGELAERDLFALRHLRPGQPAPEIAGEDIDGVKFKLSDYRGQVVLLDFWGNW
jgi:hypothetical protein